MYDLGNLVQSMGNGFTYLNVPLGDGATVNVFVRVYSGASQPVSNIASLFSLLLISLHGGFVLRSIGYVSLTSRVLDRTVHAYNLANGGSRRFYAII